jgi:DNA-binding response OmpR family regulator
MTKHILSISYDNSLLRTREMLLRGQGYLVTSALGRTNAIEQCKKGNFDLLILGHSIPSEDKKELIDMFRQHCPSPVLALRRHGENTPDGADAHAFPDDIDVFLRAVYETLHKA